MGCGVEMNQDGELMGINSDERSISFQLIFEMRGHTLTLSGAIQEGNLRTGLQWKLSLMLTPLFRYCTVLNFQQSATGARDLMAW